MSKLDRLLSQCITAMGAGGFTSIDYSSASLDVGILCRVWPLAQTAWALT